MSAAFSKRPPSRAPDPTPPASRPIRPVGGALDGGATSMRSAIASGRFGSAGGGSSGGNWPGSAIPTSRMRNTLPLSGSVTWIEPSGFTSQRTCTGGAGRPNRASPALRAASQWAASTRSVSAAGSPGGASGTYTSKCATGPRSVQRDDPELGPAVLAAPHRRLVRRDRARRAVARRLQPIRRDPLLHEVRAHGFRPLLREAHVEGLRADVV